MNTRIIRATLVDDVARAIYDQWSTMPGYVPWVLGGNATKQEDARRLAREAVEPVLGDLRRAVRTACLTGVPNFREMYDTELLTLLGVSSFNDLAFPTNGSPRSGDEALWSMLVQQAHERLGIGPDPGESPFDYLQRALQRVKPYGKTADED